MMRDHLKRTPLHEEHLALGARMTEFAGYDMPIQYSGIVAEHDAVRGGVGIFDVSHMAQFRVFGFGAFDALQKLVTNDLSRIHGSSLEEGAEELGKAVYTVICDEGGGIIDDLIVYHSGDVEFLIVANASNREAVGAWLAARLPDDVELADESDRTALIAVQGPDALRVVAELAGEGWVPPMRFRVAEGRVDTVPVLYSRTGYTGEDGVEIFCHESNAVAIWRALLSFPEVVPCGLGARDVLRLEMGYHLYGLDMDRDTDPVSAGLGWVVKLDKGDFVGREAIVAVWKQGPSHKLVPLLVEGGVPRHGMGLVSGGQVIGTIASGSFSPGLGTGIATAYVPTEFAVEGLELELRIRNKIGKATVAVPPFVKKTSLTKT
jgi:aminomethyltransferase